MDPRDASASKKLSPRPPAITDMARIFTQNKSKQKNKNKKKFPQDHQLLLTGHGQNIHSE